MECVEHEDCEYFFFDVTNSICITYKSPGCDALSLIGDLNFEYYSATPSTKQSRIPFECTHSSWANDNGFSADQITCSNLNPTDKTNCEL